jgi:two-component system sensor histidine kinase DegS
LEEDIRGVEEENGEIDMLMQQILVEFERHETRRAKLESQLESLVADPAADRAEVEEVRDSLLTQTRRELLFDAQRQVLEGKQQILARLLQRLVEIDNSLASMDDMPDRPALPAAAGLRPLADAAGGSGAPGMNQPALQMRSQEDLRRDIVRRLHDGPAQAVANIGLQAEIVERLFDKGDERAPAELESLRRLVQQALEATKTFIFEIRPMVLDDLGLGPTVRRSAADRSQRAGIPVDVGSQGIEARLDPDVESALFRSIDESIAGFLALRPPSVVVRLDWLENELIATVEGTWPRQRDGDEPADSSSRAGETPPVLLAMMAEKRSKEREAHVAAHSLPPERLQEIGSRARALGMTLTLRDDGQVVELVAPIPR